LGQNYPSFQPSYSHEDLVEDFLLTPGELDLVLKCRGDANRCGMALLLGLPPQDRRRCTSGGACPDRRTVEGSRADDGLRLRTAQSDPGKAREYEATMRMFPVR
jgi:hypothetical protein